MRFRRFVGQKKKNEKRRTQRKRKKVHFSKSLCLVPPDFSNFYSCAEESVGKDFHFDFIKRGWSRAAAEEFSFRFEIKYLAFLSGHLKSGRRRRRRRRRRLSLAFYFIYLFISIRERFRLNSEEKKTKILWRPVSEIAAVILF